MRRHLTLPSNGIAFVTPDLHGNGEDFRELRRRFLETRQASSDVHWIILGDVVHSPDRKARRSCPDLYGFDDESFEIVAGIQELQQTIPGRVHYILGNHDYGHIGGPHPAKFHVDEVAHLETSLDPAQVCMMKTFFRSALLAVVAPCGVLLAHGSPNDMLLELDDLDRIQFPLSGDEKYLAGVLESFLTSYGQPQAVTERLVSRLSEQGPEIAMVIHGHDRDTAGYFTEGTNQLCPVIFGAPRDRKTYVQLDLSARYRTVHDLSEGRELRRLYDPPTAHETNPGWTHDYRIQY